VFLACLWLDLISITLSYVKPNVSGMFSINLTLYSLNRFPFIFLLLHESLHGKLCLHKKNPVLSNCILLNMYVHQTANFQLVPAAQRCMFFPWAALSSFLFLINYAPKLTLFPRDWLQFCVKASYWITGCNECLNLSLV